jgi:hypothetical protein
LFSKRFRSRYISHGFIGLSSAISLAFFLLSSFQLVSSSLALVTPALGIHGGNVDEVRPKRLIDGVEAAKRRALIVVSTTGRTT